MAGLTFEADFNFKPIQDLINIFPELNGRFLALVGKRGRQILKEEYFSGQAIDLRAFPKDSRGRNTITSDVNKKRTVTKIYSYPNNLFERGRRLRSGRKEKGNYVVTRKLKSAITGRMASYTREFETRVIEPEAKRIGL